MKLRYGSRFVIGASCIASKFEEQYGWMEENMGPEGGCWEYKFTTFWFTNGPDAILFQLRWTE